MKKLILKKVDMKSFAMLVISVMFFWSGINKILHFEKKVETLVKKTGWPVTLCNLGMIGVILLESIGFIILLEYFFNMPLLTKLFNIFIPTTQLIQLILISVILFIILVTLIYHPLNVDRPIPFLTNLTILGGFMYIYADLF